MSTEQDSVQRLAEIRLELSKYGELPSEEVDYLLSLIDSLNGRLAEYERQDVVWVTRDEAAWLDQRADIEQRIDSLTAERDHERHRKEVAEFEREEVRSALTREIESADARAEAAEADRERLREALVRVSALADAGDATYPRHDREALARLVGWQDAALIAMSALATPPSEGGHGDD